MKLGKLPRKIDRSLLHLSNYTDRAFLSGLPTEQHWGTNIPWGMMANDHVGDCTCASAGHMVQLWTTDESGTGAVIPDQQILAAYSAISGYDPSTGDNDDGAVIADVLAYWQNVGIGGHKIGPFTAVEQTNDALVKAAIYWFGSVSIGLEMPIYARTMFEQGAWQWNGSLSGDWEPGSWGGHCVPIVGYSDSAFDIVTWGKQITMSWDFMHAYCSEVYAIISDDWVRVGLAAPNGLNVIALQQDLKKLS